METEISRSPVDVARKPGTGPGAKQCLQDPKKNTQNDDDQTCAEGDPGLKTRLAETIDGSGAIPHLNPSVDLRRVHDGDYTDRQATKNRGQDGRFQVVGTVARGPNCCGAERRLLAWLSAALRCRS